MSRRAAAGLVLAAWLVALGWLVRREVFPPAGHGVTQAVLRLPPGAAFYAIRLGDRQVGVAGTTVDTLPDGFRVAHRVDLDLSDDRGRHRIIRTTESRYDRAFHLIGFTSGRAGDDPSSRVEGQRVSDSLMTLTLQRTITDTLERLALPLAGPVILSGALPLRIVFGTPPVVGAATDLDVLDPVSLDHRRVRVRVVAESVFAVPDSATLDTVQGRWVAAHLDTLRAWRLLWEERGLPVQAWVDRAGLMVRQWSPLGLTFERSAFEIVNNNYRDAAGAPRSSSGGPIMGPVPRGDRTPAKEPAVYLLAGLTSALPALNGGLQRQHGDTVVVAARPERAANPSEPIEEQPWRTVEPLIPAGDERIAAQARRLARHRPPAEGAALLTQWVAEAIGDDAQAGVASATQVLDQRRGSPAGRAVLLTALGRAAGIPTRPVAGLYRLGGRYYFHVWVEFRLEHWTPADPTVGQFPADNAHLRLAVNTLAPPIDLVSLIGAARPIRLSGRTPTP